VNIAVVPDLFSIMVKKATNSDYLSRSALAEKLGIPLKDLTQLMIESGWIIQEGKNWQLTAKGEFEGGEYRQSQKYGQYIVWPSSVIDHPIIRESGESLVTVSTLARQFDIPARLLNRLLAEMGWIKTYAKGWQITELGKSYGGSQQHDDESGVPYVLWPRSIQEIDGFLNDLKCLNDDSKLRSLDGRDFLLNAHCKIANWLYLLGLSYSVQREMSVSDSILTPNFYLPLHQLCIDYWSESLSPAELAKQLQKRDLYKKSHFRVVEIKQDKLSDLDHFLSKELLQYGITTY
jgi:hypothetical protein